MPLLSYHSWHFTPDISLLICHSLLVTLNLLPFTRHSRTFHSRYVTLDVSLLISLNFSLLICYFLTCYSWLVTLDMSLLTCHSWHVTLDLSILTNLFWPVARLYSIIQDICISFKWQSLEILQYQTFLLLTDSLNHWPLRDLEEL